MAGNKTFRLSTGGACFAVARSGTGGTQPLPFSTDFAGDTLPFTSPSPITITSTSTQRCGLTLYANPDGHPVAHHAEPHTHFAVPAGTYFLRTGPNCSVTVS
jgi:hypothetical protein